MGILKRLLEIRKTAPPERVEIRGFIFCPAKSRTEMLTRMAEALEVWEPGELSWIDSCQDDMEISFVGHMEDGKEERDAPMREQLERVRSRFRQAETLHTEIQLALLSHLHRCRGVVEVLAAYEGPRNPEKERNIRERVGRAAKAVDGIVTRDGTILKDPDGQIILTRNGESELDFWAPAECSAPVFPENGSPERLERRMRSLARLYRRHLCYTARWPLLPERPEVSLPAEEELCGRTGALLAVGAFTLFRLREGWSFANAKELADGILEAFEAAPFQTEEERAFLENPECSEADRRRAFRRLEELAVLEWALGLLENLPWPVRPCLDVVSPMEAFPDMDALRAAAKLRPRGELLDQADLLDCLARLCGDAARLGLPAPGRLDVEVVRERRRVLFRLTGLDGAREQAVP